jgi:hypothetical protein
MSLGPFVAATASTPPGSAPSCASCGALDELVTDHDDQDVTFCLDCSAPITSIPFPEYYLDLGGESD